MALSPCNTTTDLHQRELVEHGSIAFPIACYADDLYVDSVPWHWHEEFEYAIVTAGEPDILVENSRIRLHPGEGIFINAQALHAVETLPMAPGNLHSAVFHPRLVGGNLDSIFWQKLVQPMVRDSALRYVILRPEVTWQRQVLMCFASAWQAMAQETEDYENLVRYQLSKALRLLNQNCPIIAQSPSEQERVDADRIRGMLAFIDAHYTEDLTIDAIAGSISVSASVCLRCFRQILGTTPIQYVKQLRLEKAGELLQNTAKTAREIALDCGFNDVSYFTKSFREKTGMTPRAYRISKKKEDT